MLVFWCLVYVVVFIEEFMMKFFCLLCVVLVSLFLLVVVVFVVCVVDNVICVGIDVIFLLMEFVKDGKCIGFDIELMEVLVKIMGKKIQWIDIDFKGLIFGFIFNCFDIVVLVIYMIDECCKVVIFSDFYYWGGLVVLVWCDDNSIKVLEDLNKGKCVLVQVGIKLVSYLCDNFFGVECVEVEKNQVMFDLLVIGCVNVVVIGCLVVVEYVCIQLLVCVLDKGLIIELYGFVLCKNDIVLVEYFNKVLQILCMNGIYDVLIDKWFVRKD